MKKISPYVKKRLAQIKKEQPKPRIKKPKVKRKTVEITLFCRGFYMNMNIDPNDPIDQVIMQKANNLIYRRAS